MLFETQSKKLQVLMPWILNYKHKIEEKSTKSSRSSSKFVGLGLADLWEFPTLAVNLLKHRDTLLWISFKLPTSIYLNITCSPIKTCRLRHRNMAESDVMVGIFLKKLLLYNKSNIDMTLKTLIAILINSLWSSDAIWWHRSRST